MNDHPPLTHFSEDELMFRDAIADFANREIRPHVAQMDADQKIRPEIIRKCFDLGLMGIEVPGKWGGSESSFFMAILAIEELLDYANRATMRDDQLHPIARQISRLHVLEEARHVSFAKTYLTECWPTLDSAEQHFVKAVAPDLVGEIVALSLDPAVFEHLDITNGIEIAKANPAYQANVVAGLSKLTTFLSDVGVIDDPEPWLERGLIAVEPAEQRTSVIAASS